MILMLLLLTANSNAAPWRATDPRQIYTGGEPQWPAAIGKLSVPSQKYRGGYRNHYIQDCSATLVSKSPIKATSILVSAWHCFEHYRDLSQPIKFSVNSKRGPLVSRRARLLNSGGDMGADWAILRLDQAFAPTEVTALQPHPVPDEPLASIAMGGYSRDPGLGALGEVLTYHPGCGVTQRHRELSHSDCLVFKGASGGTVVSQWPGDGKYYFAGVVSAGNGGDTSIFVPLGVFNSKLVRYLD